MTELVFSTLVFWTNSMHRLLDEQITVATGAGSATGLYMSRLFQLGAASLALADFSGRTRLVAAELVRHSVATTTNGARASAA
jgi:hypothetical protein